MNITKFEKSVDNEYFYSKSIFLEFEKPTYQQLFDMVSTIRKYDSNMIAYVQQGSQLTNLSIGSTSYRYRLK